MHMPTGCSAATTYLNDEAPVLAPRFGHNHKRIAKRGCAIADDNTGQAKIIYILYLAGFIVGITPLIGIVMAYMNRGEGSDWIQSHYQWQIRTF